MRKKWLVAVAVAGALIVPVAARAHGGHLHKVMGTVSSVQGNQVTVRTTDGKTVVIMLDSKTTITRGKTKLNGSAVKAGERVVVEGTEAKQMIAAKTVRLGTGTTNK